LIPKRPLIEELLTIWFEGSDDPDWGRFRSYWFEPDSEFDQMLAEHFSDASEQAAQGKLDHLSSSPEGTLALLLLLDQLPRNLYRDDRRAFASDPKALSLAKEAVAAGTDQLVEPLQRWFFYLPFEHSENIHDQDLCISLFEKLGPDHQRGLDYAQRHRAVIQRFGRFPHRNKILRRKSTAEEAKFLASTETGF
jgi:uncharacterized protein (DUF924 family)